MVNHVKKQRQAKLQTTTTLGAQTMKSSNIASPVKQVNYTKSQKISFIQNRRIENPGQTTERSNLRS